MRLLKTETVQPHQCSSLVITWLDYFETEILPSHKESCTNFSVIYFFDTITIAGVPLLNSTPQLWVYENRKCVFKYEHNVIIIDKVMMLLTL